MTQEHPRDQSQHHAIEPIVDPESLRDRPDVPFHDETEIVDDETVEVVAGLNDMAPVGVTNDDGAVLVLQIDEDCAPKIPSPEVGPAEDFASAARNWVEAQAGLTITLEDIAGVWHVDVRAERSDRSASRYFVVYRAAVAADEEGSEIPASAPADGAGWVHELPAGAEEPPGTDLFFD